MSSSFPDPALDDFPASPLCRSIAETLRKSEEGPEVQPSPEKPPGGPIPLTGACPWDEWKPARDVG